MNTTPPKIGQTMKVYGQICTITRVLPAGTVDVISPAGSAYRVTGLPFRSPAQNEKLDRSAIAKATTTL